MNKRRKCSTVTSLLDLEDALLIKILEHLKDVAAIVRCGSFNHRFNRLPLCVGFLETTIYVGNFEKHFSTFLKRVAERGGPLRHVIVTVSDHRFSPQDIDQMVIFPIVHNNLARMRWTRYICTDHLQTLHLDMWASIVKGGACTMLSDIARCSNLTSLHMLIRATEYRDLHPSNLAQVVASCRKLKDLVLKSRSHRDEPLELVNPSVESIEIWIPGTLITLDTPALTTLKVNCSQLSLRSQVLKKLVFSWMEGRMKFATSSPLNLKFLAVNYVYDSAALSITSDVLQSISGGCLDELRLEDYILTGDSLPTLLQPLTRLKRFCIGGEAIRVFAMSPECFDEYRMSVERLRVAEMEVKVDTRLDHPAGATQHYTHIVNTLVLLRSFLESSFLEKVVIDYCSLINDCSLISSELFLTQPDMVKTYRIRCRSAQALLPLVQALEEEFPGKVTCNPRRVAIRFDE